MKTEFAHAARQDRSQATQDRIVAAFVELLDEQPFDALAVAEIARRAGVSVGAFYKRFPSKEALLLHADTTCIGPLIEQVAEATSPSRLLDMDLPEMLRVYIEATVTALVTRPGLVRAVSLFCRGSDDPAYRERVRRRNQRVYSQVRNVVRERAKDIAHPDPDEAFDFANTMVTAAAREAILHSDRPITRQSRQRRRQLVTQLTHAFASYLRSPLR